MATCLPEASSSPAVGIRCRRAGAVSTRADSHGSGGNRAHWVQIAAVSVARTAVEVKISTRALKAVCAAGHAAGWLSVRPSASIPGCLARPPGHLAAQLVACGWLG